MSRIHEALKKAEEERRTGASQPAAPAAAAPVQAANLPRPALQLLRLDDLRNCCARPNWNADPNRLVFTNGNRASLAAEQFRTLRSRLERLRGKQPIRSLLITSALPAEGKTLVAANLAQAIVCQQNRSALLIDADLRSPTLHRPLGAPLTPGLSDYLRGDADEPTIVQCGSSDNLFLISGGAQAQNPAELLAQVRMKTLLDRMTKLFDWVILDSPPTLPVADAGGLATLCDGVLMVVSAGTTHFEDAQRACLEFHDKNLIGVILNRAKESAAYAAYYYSPDYKEKQP